MRNIRSLAGVCLVALLAGCGGGDGGRADADPCADPNAYADPNAFTDAQCDADADIDGPDARRPVRCRA